jgi:hypothetical protein
MAYPYDEERDPSRRYDRNEEDARRAAERRAEQARRDEERDWDRGPRRQREGDYAAGWWGEEAAEDGYTVPGPYGRPPEQRPDRRSDEAFYQRFDEPHAYQRREARMHSRPEREHREHRSFEEEARRAGQSLARGWRRLTEGARHTFEGERGPDQRGPDQRGPDQRGLGERDPDRSGGMFGGRDRPGSLFNHDDGLGPSARPGSHRGKGPKGYVRGDERILEEVCDRLTEDDRLDACDIEVKIDQGEVTLNGQVENREDKRRAEDIAESVSGVKHLQNNLRIRPFVEPAQRPAAQAAPKPAAKAAPMSSSDAPAPTSAQIPDQSSEAAAPGPRTPRPN